MSISSINNITQLLLREKALSFFCVILLICVWSFVLWFIDNDQKNALFVLEQNGNKFCGAFEAHVRHMFDSNKQSLFFIKTEYEKTYSANSRLEFFINSIAKDSFITQVLLLNEQGLVIYKSLPLTKFKTENENFFINPALKTRIQSNQTVITSANNSIIMTRRLDKPDGSFAGVAVIIFNNDYFTEFFHDLSFNQSYIIRIVGLDKVVIFSNDKTEIGRNMAASSLFEELANSPQGFYLTPGKVFGKKRYVSYRTMTDYPFIVQVGLQETALFSANNRKIIYLCSAAVFSIFIIIYTHILLIKSRQRKQADRRYKALMNNAFDGIILVEPDNYTIVERNKRFNELFGFAPRDIKILSLKDFIVDFEEKKDILFETTVNGIIYPQIISCQIDTKQKHTMEFAGTKLSISNHNFYLLSLRNLTSEREKEREVLKAAKLANLVQKSLLPQIHTPPGISLKTFFQPLDFVSGDVFHIEWSEKDMVLRGWLVDVSGHGIGTALQTAALNVLLHEVAAQKFSMSEQIHWLNNRAKPYFDETSFAAAIAFELDLKNKELRYIGAGITDFYFNGNRIIVPGSFIGLEDIEDFSEGRLTINNGDSICFITDGLSNLVNSLPSDERKEMCKKFDSLLFLDQITDDATAISIYIDFLPDK